MQHEELPKAVKAMVALGLTLATGQLHLGPLSSKVQVYCRIYVIAVST